MRCTVRARAAAFYLSWTGFLILLDIDMPGKHGREIARELGQDVTLRDIPILFLTSLVPRSEGYSQTLKSGGQIILTKPVEPQFLLDCVSKALPSPLNPWTIAEPDPKSCRG
jgi:CheY-like chemotaxis protein